MSMDQDEIKAFLKHHRIKSEQVFDAGGMSRSEYQLKMKKEGKLFALNVDACSFGHMIRTRSGHCIVCDTSNIKYYKDWYRYSYVYVGGSLSLSALKIGTSDDPNDRMRRLNSEGYGGSNDWNVLLAVRVNESGRIENEVIALLKKYFVKAQYQKNNKLTSTKEIVRCSFSEAREALISVLADDEKKEIKEMSNITLQRYDF